MASLHIFGDEIARLVLEEDKTREQVYQYLIKKYGQQKGLSLRSVKRYCQIKGYHRVEPNQKTRTAITDGFKAALAKAAGLQTLVTTQSENDTATEQIIISTLANSIEVVCENGSSPGLGSHQDLTRSPDSQAQQQQGSPRSGHGGMRITKQLPQSADRVGGNDETVPVAITTAANDGPGDGHLENVLSSQPASSNPTSSSAPPPASATATTKTSTSSAAAQSTSRSTGSSSMPTQMTYKFTTGKKTPSRKRKTVVLEQEMSEYQRQKLQRMDTQNQLLRDLCLELQVLRSGLFAVYDIQVAPK